MANKYEDYKTTTDLRTHSAINRIALQKRSNGGEEFNLGDMAFFISKGGLMVVGKIVVLKDTAVKLDVDGKMWLVPIDRLSLY